MTDKQIMDDVDVSGCEHLTEIQGCWLSTCDYLKHKGNITSKVCKYNPNCYFKQLARKTQECEKLKEQLMETKTFDLFADKLIEKFNTDSAIASIFKDNIRYRKALEEIEGIVKNFGSYAAWQEQRINKILDIINKAKGR